MLNQKKCIVARCICCIAVLSILFLIFSGKKLDLLLPEVTDSSVCMIVLTDQPTTATSTYLSDSRDVQVLVDCLKSLKIKFVGMVGSSIYTDGVTYRLVFGEGNHEAGDILINGNDVYCKNFHFKMPDEDAVNCLNILLQIMVESTLSKK